MGDNKPDPAATGNESEPSAPPAAPTERAAPVPPIAERTSLGRVEGDASSTASTGSSKNFRTNTEPEKLRPAPTVGPVPSAPPGNQPVAGSADDTAAANLQVSANSGDTNNPRAKSLAAPDSTPILSDPAFVLRQESRDHFLAAAPKPKPENAEAAIEREISSGELRGQLRALTRKAIGEREIGSLVVFASEIDGPCLAIAGGLCSAARYLKMQGGTFGRKTDALAVMIEDWLGSERVADLIIDARGAAQHPPFWQINERLAEVRAACETAHVQIVLIIAGSDLKRTAGAEDWRDLAAVLHGIETEVVIALAKGEDERLTREPAQAALRRWLDKQGSIQELWDALARDELLSFVDELQKDYQARTGRRETIFRETVIDLETRNPAQASALFLGSFVPGLKKDTFLNVHRHLHLIAATQWPPRKKDKDGGIEKWDPFPADFDRERVGIAFESDGTDPILRAMIGGAAVLQFKELFNRIGVDALQMFVEAGLTTFPLLATGDDNALSALTTLTEEKLRREHVSQLDNDTVRAEILALALSHTPQQLRGDHATAVAAAAPNYLSDIAERLPLAGRKPGAAATDALKLLLEDVLEIARRCDLQEEGADWLHDVIARTAFISPALRWRMVFSDIYENKARLRQRALLTDRFWLITTEAVRGRADLLRQAMREAARLAAERDCEEWKRAFRVQLFSRLLTVWMFSADEAMTEGAPDAERARVAVELFDAGFVKELAVALAAPDFNNLHSRLVEIEFDVVLRTRGSESDEAVLGRLNHERVINSTCLAVLRVLLPLSLLDQHAGSFLDRFAGCIDRAGAANGDGRVPGFFAHQRWTPDSITADDIEAVFTSSPFGRGVSRWLAAMPLAMVLAERELSGTPTPISEILSQAPRPKEAARQWGKLIDSLRPDLLCGREALKDARREVRAKGEAYLKHRLSQLAAVREEVLAVVRAG